MSTLPEIELRTERLLLRPLRVSDAPAIQRFAGDERVSRFTSNIPHPYPDGAAEAFVADVLRKQVLGELRNFAITLAGEPDALIGLIGLRNREDLGLELGYWLAVPYWGKGLMSEAACAVARHGLEWRPDATVIAHTFPENAASRRVLEKSGFRRRGTGACNAPARGRVIEDAPLFVFEPKALSEAAR